MVLLPETFKRLDHSKHTLVAMCEVHPCDWSLLSLDAPRSSILSLFVRWLIGSRYLFAKVSLYFSLCMSGTSQDLSAVLLTNPQDLNKLIHNPLLFTCYIRSQFISFTKCTLTQVSNNSNLSASRRLLQFYL